MDNTASAENKDRILLPYDKIGVNSTFKTSINGFNKESVLFYIDNLRKDAATQQRTFTVEIDRLYTKNVELSRSVANCEKEIDSLTTRLEQEREKHRLLEDENSLLNNVVEKMQGKMGELQGEIESQRSAAYTLSQRLYASEQRANVLQQAAQKASEQLRSSSAYNQDTVNRTNQLAQQVDYLNAQSQQRAMEFASRAAQYEQTIEYFRASYNSLTDENKQLKIQSMSAEQLRTQNDSLSKTIASLQQRMQSMQTEAAQQSEYVRSLINKLNDLKNRSVVNAAPYLSTPSQQPSPYRQPTGYTSQPQAPYNRQQTEYFAQPHNTYNPQQTAYPQAAYAQQPQYWQQSPYACAPSQPQQSNYGYTQRPLSYAQGMQLPQPLRDAHAAINSAAAAPVQYAQKQPERPAVRPGGSYVQSFGINIG